MPTKLPVDISRELVRALILWYVFQEPIPQDLRVVFDRVAPRATNDDVLMGMAALLLGNREYAPEERQMMSGDLHSYLDAVDTVERELTCVVCIALARYYKNSDIH